MKIKRKLMLGDCLERMKDIPDNSVDMILCDPPYGTTKCSWDTVIDFELMWKELKRITKDNGAICLFGSEPFSSALRMSNIKMFKYDWVWHKNVATNFLHAKRQPLRCYELIHVFYKKSGKYYPIRTIGHKPTQSAKGEGKNSLYYGKRIRNYKGGDTTRLPQNLLLGYKVVDAKVKSHPTQKPVPLLQYLIKTYTLPGETVLDFTTGSGSTGVAAMIERRSFIGIEEDKEYFKIAKERIKNWKEEE